MAEKKNFKDEILSDAELDNVAGGTYIESAGDAKKFNELGVKIYENEIAGIPVLTHDEFEKLRSTFNQYGVTIKDHGGLSNANEYFIDGNKVTRDEAWKHINSQLTK